LQLKQYEKAEEFYRKSVYGDVAKILQDSVDAMDIGIAFQSLF